MTEYDEKEINLLKKYYPKYGVIGVQKHINRSCDSIRHKAKSLGITRENGFRESKLDFNNLMRPKDSVSSYLLGLIWGDGTITIAKNNKGYNTSVTLQEKDFFELKDKNIFNNFHIYKVKKMRPQWKQTYRAAIGHKKLAIFLKENDYCEKSSKTPEKILNKIPKEFKKDFIRGWFDADGSSNAIRRKKYAVSFSGSHEQDWSILEFFCDNNGLFYKITRTKSKWGNYSIFVIKTKESVLKFFNLIYENGPFLQRKYENFLIID